MKHALKDLTWLISLLVASPGIGGTEHHFKALGEDDGSKSQEAICTEKLAHTSSKKTMA